MTPGGFIKRHFDIKLLVGTLPAGGPPLLVTIQTPVDAPFVLKARAARCQTQPSSATNPGQTLMSGLAWKYAGPDDNFYAQDMVPFGLEAYNYGQVQNGLWLQTSIVYQPDSTIQSYVQNQAANDIPGLELYFRGYQLFRCGQVPGLTYPSHMSTNPYTIVTGPGAPVTPGTLSPTNPLLQVTDTQLLLLLNAPSDSDFVLRAGQCVSPSALGTSDPYPLQTYIKLRDWNQKAYSNDYIHTDILFGQDPIFNLFASGNPGRNGYQAGLFTPEIYLPKNQFLYYDLQRQDAYLSSQFSLSPQAESFFIGWKGSKVYAQ